MYSATAFAKAGFTVIGYDVSQRVVDLLNRGESHIQDVPAADVAEAVRAGRFIATAEESRLRECDGISIAEQQVVQRQHRRRGLGSGDLT